MVSNQYPDSKVHGANMGPTWVLSVPDGPHVGTMDLAIRVDLSWTRDGWHGSVWALYGDENPSVTSGLPSQRVSYVQFWYFRCWPWWRHQMETFSAWLALCAGNSPVPVNSPHKSQWRGALMFSLICVWINDWVNNREADDLRRYRGHFDVMVMPGSAVTQAVVDLRRHVTSLQ